MKATLIIVSMLAARRVGPVVGSLDSEMKGELPIETKRTN